MGGKDVLHMKQLRISNMEPFTFLQLLKQLADRKFTEDTDDGSPSLNRIVSSAFPKVPESLVQKMEEFSEVPIYLEKSVLAENNWHSKQIKLMINCLYL